MFKKKKKKKKKLKKFNYFTKKKYNLQKKKKNPLKETKILQDIISTLYLISSFNRSQNKYHVSKILV